MDGFGVYKEAELTGRAPGSTLQVKEREKWRKLAGFLPEQLTGRPATEPGSPVALGLSQPPFSVSSLRSASNHLALCFNTSWPGTTDFSNLASNCCPSHAVPSIKTVFQSAGSCSHTPNPCPSVPLCPNPRHAAQATENATCPTKTPLALPAGRSREPAPPFLFLKPHTTPLFVWSASVHISNHWLNLKLQKEWTLVSFILFIFSHIISLHVVCANTLIKIFKQTGVKVWKTRVINYTCACTRKLLSCSSSDNLLQDRYLEQELLASSQRLPLSLLLNLSINSSKLQCPVYIWAIKTSRRKAHPEAAPKVFFQLFIYFQTNILKKIQNKDNMIATSDMQVSKMLRTNQGNNPLPHSPRDAPAQFCQQHLWKEFHYFCSWCPRCHLLQSHNLKLEKREREGTMKLSLDCRQTQGHSTTQNEARQITRFQTADSPAREE